jgi:hypothetical protein
MEKDRERFIRYISVFTPHLKDILEEDSEGIGLKIKDSYIRINMSSLQMVIEGKLSLLALSLARRINIDFVYWTANTNTAIIEGRQDRRNTLRVYTILLTFLSLFNDIDIASSYRDKDIIVFLRGDGSISEIHVFHDFKIIRIETDSIFVKEIVMKEDIRDPVIAKRVIETATKDILKQEEEKPKVIPVYGEATQAEEIIIHSRNEDEDEEDND